MELQSEQEIENPRVGGSIPPLATTALSQSENNADPKPASAPVAVVCAASHKNGLRGITRQAERVWPPIETRT